MLTGTLLLSSGGLNPLERMCVLTTGGVSLVSKRQNIGFARQHGEGAVKGSETVWAVHTSRDSRPTFQLTISSSRFLLSTGAELTALKEKNGKCLELTSWRLDAKFAKHPAFFEGTAE